MSTLAQLEDSFQAFEATTRATWTKAYIRKRPMRRNTRSRSARCPWLIW